MTVGEAPGEFFEAATHAAARRTSRGCSQRDWSERPHIAADTGEIASRRVAGVAFAGGVEIGLALSGIAGDHIPKT